MRQLPGSPPVGKLSEMTEIDIVSAHMIHGAVEYQRRGTPDVHVLISNSQNVVDSRRREPLGRGGLIIEETQRKRTHGRALWLYATVYCS